jgi:hypothetical protein
MPDNNIVVAFDSDGMKVTGRGFWLNGSLMDGTHDNEDLFKFLKEKGVAMPGIKIRKNAIVKARLGKSRVGSRVAATASPAASMKSIYQKVWLR